MLTTTKQKLNTKTLINRAVRVLLAVQLLFLAYLILRAGARTVDVDAGNVYTHTREMWRQGTIFLKDWSYVTTVELDCATLLALPLYGLCGNIALAFQLADLCVLALIMVLVYALMRRLQASRTVALLGCLLVCTPYDYAQLSYCNMLYANAAQYCVKVFLPLLLCYLLVGRRDSRRTKGDWALTAVYLLLVLCTGLSSGVYVAACGLAPVLVVEIWRWLQEKHKLDAYRFTLVGGSVAATLGGIAITAINHVQTKGFQATLVTLETFHRNMVGCILGIFQVFVGIAYDETPAMSPAGMRVLLMGAFTMALLVTGAVTIRALLRHNGLVPETAAYLAAIPCGNMLLLMLCDTQYGATYYEFRYHLMGIVPLLLLLALLLPKLSLVQPARLRYALQGAAAAFLAAVILLSNGLTYRAIKQMSTGAGVNNQQYALCAYLDTLGVQNAYFVDDSISSGLCRSIDDSPRNYVAYDPYENYLYLYDYYRIATDGVSCGGLGALVVHMGNQLDNLPVYITENATLAGTVACFDVYTIPEPCLDGAIGLPFGEHALDYCDSTGYEYQGTMDAARRLHTDGNSGVVVENLELPLHAPVNITLDYTAEKAAEGMVGTLEIWQNSQMLAQADLIQDGSAAVLENVYGEDGGAVVLRITMNEGAAAALGALHFDAVDAA